MSAHEELLVCNLRNCRRRIGAFAWVTSCSHVFCDRDGGREFRGANSCPACGAALSGKLDVVRVNLDPSERCKSMVLAGLRPNILLEICSRALSFWTYQVCQERLYQQHVAGRSKVLMRQMEGRAQQSIQSKATEIAALKEEISSAKSELARFKRRCSESAEALLEKERRQQRLRNAYGQLRMRAATIRTARGFDDDDGGGEEAVPDGGPSPAYIRRSGAAAAAVAAGDAAAERLAPGHSRNSERRGEFVLAPSYFKSNPLCGAHTTSGNFKFEFAYAASTRGQLEG